MGSGSTKVVQGQQCMVSTGHALASAAAIDVLRGGGNAVDAAIAASAVLCVVLPNACGLGGDAFAIGYDTNQNATWALNASGRSPGGFTAETFSSGIPEDEVISSTVPGIVEGWRCLQGRYATWPIDRLLQRAITLADEGVEVDGPLASIIQGNHQKLARHPFSSALFLPSKRPLRVGERFRQPDLARTLSRLVSAGCQDFYVGEIGKRIDGFMSRNGGLIREKDLKIHESRWEAPIFRPFLEFEVAVTPPNSLAVLLLAQLERAPIHSLRQASPHSTEYVDPQIQTKRAVFAELLPLLGDPDAMTTNIKEVLRSRKTFGSTSRGANPGRNPRPETPDTTCVVVVDQKGNVVSLIQSLFHHFGSGVIAGDTGILFNNRMVGFRLGANQVNSLAPRKRPAHTLSPALLLRNKKPFLAICTPGAYAQTQTLFQVLVNFLVAGMDLQKSLEAPRWFDELDHRLLVESRMEAPTIEGLKSLGYQLRMGEAWDPLTGGVQAIEIRNNQAKTTLLGAADPRRNGCAMGW